MNRIYVCHTYYNVYVSILKELIFLKFNDHKGTIALSTISTDFKDLKLRLDNARIFHEVIELNEVHPKDFEVKYKYDLKNSNWFFKSFINVFFLWKYRALQEEKYLNINFSNYNDIYVYCDSDPIGQFLNYRKIHYHAVEDGLDSCKLSTVKGTSKFFYIKLFLAKLGYVFIKDGYSKYAIDLEVNSKKHVDSFGRNLTELPRAKLLELLVREEKEKIYDIFFVGTGNKKFTNDNENILLMTQPLCSLDKRIEMYRDVIQKYCKGYNVYIKPHPIDSANYEKEFPDCIVLERFFPIEIFNIKCELDIEKIITIYTYIQDLNFSKKKIRLGVDFLDDYEDSILHKELVDAENIIESTNKN